MVTDLIYDHLGNKWQVNNAEPATRIVSALRKRNYEFIVLPFRVLATGDDDGKEYTAEGVVNNQRLQDCLYVLRKR